jgi:desulfoferrodoxin (superoxide reductase-like protein)
MVEVLIPSDGALACGTPMVENTTDAAREKHVPEVGRLWVRRNSLTL